MRRDLFIGFIISLAIHGGIASVGKPAPKPKQKEEPPPTIQIWEIPKIEPDEPEKVEANDEPVTPVDFAPPMQTDVPQVVTPESFTQVIQPPPPEGLKPAGGVLVIPGNRTSGIGKGIQVFDVNTLDKIPGAKFQTKPQYPFEMRRAGIGGEVLVDFIVTDKGTVINAYALKSSQREFEASAVAAVSKWTFTPGKKSGKYVNTRMQVPIVFNLNEE